MPRNTVCQLLKPLNVFLKWRREMKGTHMMLSSIKITEHLGSSSVVFGVLISKQPVQGPLLNRACALKSK